MRIVLSPVGSAGDVYPFVGLGLELRSRGHEVVFLTTEYFQPLLDRVGLRYVEFVSRETFERSLNNPDLWHRFRGFRHVFRSAVAPHMERQFDLVSEYGQAEDTIVLSSCLGIGARIAQEAGRIRLLTVHLQPAVLWSKHLTPQLPGMPAAERVPGWFKQFQFWLGCKLLIDPVALPDTNRFRARYGLEPVVSLVDWWNSPTGVVGLFPEWYAPPQPDWPRQVELTQFPLWTEAEVDGIPAEVEAFLQLGSPPIAFTPGSAMRFGRAFFETAATACQRLGRRAIFLTRFSKQVPQPLPPHCLHVPYAPFGLLLRKVAAVVHHGGIGTTSQALAAGVPQLIMPLTHDQPDNAARVRRLGVGDTVLPEHFRPRRVAQRLEKLLSSSQVADSCRQTAARFEHVDPFADTCLWIERLAATTRK